MRKNHAKGILLLGSLGLALFSSQAKAQAVDEAAAIRALNTQVQLPEPKLSPKLTPEKDPHERGLSFGGPRFGISYCSGEGFEKLKKEVAKTKPDVTIEQTMSQFGWQIEYRMFRTDQGLTALTEFIPLVGGMDQGLALPSVTWLVGLRGANGFEVGVGPNIGLNGVAMMLGMGFTFDVGGINIPFNIAYGRGANQTTSAAISTGFNL